MNPQPRDDAHALDTPAIIALILSMGLVGMSFGASAPLVASLLEERGFSEYYTGAVSGTLSLAIALFSPVAGRLVQRVGPRRINLTGIILQGVCFSALGLALATWEHLLFPVRFALGLAASATFVAAETALLRGVQPHRRGRAMAGYGTVLGLGYAGGVIASGPAYAWIGLWCFGLVGLIALAVAPVCRWGMRSLPRPAPPRHDDPPEAAMRWRPVVLGIFGAVIFGVLDNGMTGVYPVEGQRLGLDRIEALNVVGVMLVASMLAQPVCGILADRIGVIRVLTGLAVVGMGGSLVTGWIAWNHLGYNPTLIGYFFVGLAGGGAYPVCLKLLGDRVRSDVLPRANAAFSSAYGYASLFGPLAGAGLIDAAQAAGLLGWALPGLSLTVFAVLVPLILLDRHWRKFPAHAV